MSGKHQTSSAHGVRSMTVNRFLVYPMFTRRPVFSIPDRHISAPSSPHSPSFEPRCEKTGFLYMRKQRSRSASAKLISAFVFATRIVQSLYFLNPKFQASNHLRCGSTRTCSEPPKTGFLTTRFIFYKDTSNHIMSTANSRNGQTECHVNTHLALPKAEKFKIEL